VDEVQILQLTRQAIREGKRSEARQLLTRVLRDNPRSETAWLWLSAIVDDPAKERQCLERVLAIDPDNEIAQRGLAGLDEARVSIAPVPPSLIPCPHCGKRIRQTSQFCGYCGRKISAVDSDNPAQASQPSQRRPQVLPIVGLSALGLIVVAVLIAVSTLVYRNLFTADPSTSARTTEETRHSPSTIKPSATPPHVSSVCRSATQDYLDEIQASMVEFLDTVDVADSTPRIALAPLIQDMQRLRRDIQKVAPPDCARPASSLLMNGIDGIINGFTSFLANDPDATVSRRLNQGMLDFDNGFSQLSALASGKATPVPVRLPTSTPIPTQIPTPTPLPAGDYVRIDNWQIRVERVELAEQSTSFGHTYRAEGQFAWLFLEVTNRGLSPDTFVAYGKIDVQDATGRRSQEDVVITGHGQDRYNTDLGAQINPDETRHLVAGYDIAKGNGPYVLVPGILADPYISGVLLDIP